MKKYKILYDSELIIHKHVLHRIEACCTFRTFQGSLVREGEVGGWIESNKNLSQSKFSWVFDEGKVYGDSQVLDDAVVMDTAEVYQNAKIYNKAREDEICVSNGYTYRLEDYLNMLNNQSFNKERDILLLAKKY